MQPLRPLRDDDDIDHQALVTRPPSHVRRLDSDERAGRLLHVALPTGPELVGVYPAPGRTSRRTVTQAWSVRRDRSVHVHADIHWEPTAGNSGRNRRHAAAM